MAKETQFSIRYCAFAHLPEFLQRDPWVGPYRRTDELLHTRETLSRESAAELLMRETLSETDLERIRALATAPVLPPPKAA